MLGFAGATARDISVASVTLSTASSERLPYDALMTELPTFLPITRPGTSIAAVPGSDETQVTDAVRSCVVLSE
jgi:hypothetical protein